MVQLHPAFQPPARHHRGHADQQLVLLSRRQVHPIVPLSTARPAAAARSSRSTAQRRNHRAAQRGAVGRKDARDQHAVPGTGAALRQASAARTHRVQRALPRPARHAPTSPRRARRRRSLRAAMSRRPRRPAGSRHAAASDRRAALDQVAQPGACDHTLTHRRAAEHQRSRRRGTRRPSASSTSSRRSSAQRSNRIVSCGSHSTAAARRHHDPCPHARRRAARQRTIEPFRRLRRDRRARAGAQLERTVQPIAAGDPTGRVQRDRRWPNPSRHRRGETAPSGSRPGADPSSTVRSPSRARRPTRSSPTARCSDRGVRQRGGVVHPLRPAPPAARTARCRRDPSPRSSGPAPGRNRNTARPAGWPCRPATATARSPGRCP